MGGIDPDAMAALGLTVKVAATAIVFGLPLAVAVSYLLARYRFPGHMILNGLVHLPLVMPPVVTGYGLLLLFGPAGPLGQFLNEAFGITLAFRWTGAALAAAIMAFPLMVRPIRVAIESVDQGLESAAETLGAGRFLVFLTVTLPLALPGIIAAMILGFAKALGEFGATITFVSNIPGETRTLALAIYSLTQSPDGDRAALMLAGLSVALAFAAVIGSELVVRHMQARLGGKR